MIVLQVEELRGQGFEPYAYKLGKDSLLPISCKIYTGTWEMVKSLPVRVIVYQLQEGLWLVELLESWLF